jgi:hypothetical protein
MSLNSKRQNEKKPHFGAYNWPKMWVGSWKGWISINNVQTGPQMEQPLILTRLLICSGMENWWVKWTSIVTHLLAETENISSNRYVTKHLVCYIPAACCKGESHHTWKTSLWSVVCTDGWNFISTRAPVLPSFFIVFLGSTQVNGRSGLYKGYTCFHSSTFLKMYVRILSPHATIYITAADRHVTCSLL